MRIHVFSAVMPRLDRGIQYSRAISVDHGRLWKTGSPVKPQHDTETLFGGVRQPVRKS
jgi:hypothetical protein